MPSVSAARSRACAMGVRSSSLQHAAICATGVTETRLLTMGIPYSRSRFSAVSTRCSAVCVTWSYIFVHMRSRFSLPQPMSETPMVMVLMSRFCSSTMPRVSAISAGVIAILALLSAKTSIVLSILTCRTCQVAHAARFDARLFPLCYCPKTSSAIRALSAASLA